MNRRVVRRRICKPDQTKNVRFFLRCPFVYCPLGHLHAHKPMLNQATIEARLAEMRDTPAPHIAWDETCEGSGRALVVFVGPSPGGQKPEARRSMNKACFTPLWNVPFDEPLSWSPGFRISFQPLVEALFELPYPIAAKLIARANLDWLGNPESKDVAEYFMFEGAPSTLQLLKDCSPELILPMDFKTFRVLREVLLKAGFKISDCATDKFSVRISEQSQRYHRSLHAYFAARDGREMLVMKLPQHPARIFRADYATRCGTALRHAAIRLCTERNAISADALSAIERHFHNVILGRATQMHHPPTDLQLPKLDQMTPTSEAEPAWFPVPGMYGGFAYWLDFTGESPRLITESWSRVCGGSGQRHEIDASGSRLTAEGFV